MSITVAELLAEPQLGLRLLAGRDGTGRKVTWAHTSDLPRLWEWVTGGELMMTNGLSIPESVEEQVAMARALFDAGASAFAIGEKMHAPALHPEFLQACDSLPLPLINIPYPLPFIAIARTVAESSLLEESRRLRQTARIYDLLRPVGKSDGEWLRLSGGVSTELGADVLVVERRALQPWHPGGQKPPAELLEELGTLIGESVDTARKFQWQHLADGKQVLMMDIPTHADAVMVVLPKVETHPDPVVLLHAATVLGLELSRTELTLENDRRLGAEFLQQAFDGNYNAAELDHRLTEFGINSAHLSVVSMQAASDHELSNVHVELWRRGIRTLSVRRADRLHLVLTGGGPDTVLSQAGPSDLRVGMSKIADSTSLRQALQESLWALGTASSLGQGVVHYEDGPQWLGLSNLNEGQALVKRLLGPIFDYENKTDGDLIVTLRTFLSLQRSWQKTAAALFTHRQTVIYRMKKVGELTGLDLAETSSVAQLWFALQIHEAMDFA